MKMLFVTLSTFAFLGLSIPQVYAEEEVLRRRPDQVEFQTEYQVRLAPESVTVAEVDISPQSDANNQSFWQFLRQSWQDFVTALKSLFNIP